MQRVESSRVAYWACVGCVVDRMASKDMVHWVSRPLAQDWDENEVEKEELRI